MKTCSFTIVVLGGLIGQCAASLERKGLVAEFERIQCMLEVDAGAAAAITDTHVCHDKSLPLVGGKTVMVDRPYPPHTPGSGTSLYLGHLDDHTDHDAPLMLVKVSSPAPSDHTRHAMATEAAVLSILRGRAAGMVPNIFHIETNSAKISHQCRARTIVTEFPGSYTLASLPPPELTDVDPGATVGQVASIIAKVLEIIERVHESGFVHGDIHLNNFVYSDEENVVGTLRLIEFARAAPFIDESGRHVLSSGSAPPESSPHRSPVELLSPWEIEGSPRLSRRDDLFRIAEMALRMAGLDGMHIERLAAEKTAAVQLMRQEGFTGDVNEYAPFRRAVADLKRNRPKPTMGTPWVFREFYRYALRLSFDSTPNYESFGNAFSRLADSGVSAVAKPPVSPPGGDAGPSVLGGPRRSQTVTTASAALAPTALSAGPSGPRGGSPPSAVPDGLHILGARAVEFERVRARLVSLASGILSTDAPAGDKCPPKEITIGVFGGVDRRFVRVPSLPVARGSSTRVFLAGLADGTKQSHLVVKVLENVKSPTLVDSLAREAAFG